MTPVRVGSSFRDPSGFLFTRDGTLQRQVQPSFAPHYDHLKTSGLYDALVAQSLLVPHDELGPEAALIPGAYQVLRPEVIPVVSFPYEWCFGQLKAAAVLTLRIQELAIAHGMTLKDASAFNVQFRGTAPVLVDTLSFARLEEGQPWVAYRQFCQHFLAPLALQASVDVRLRALQREFLDGVPLDLASRLLPASSWLRPWALAHIHLHARAISRFASATDAKALPARRVSRQGLVALVGHLRRAVASLDWAPAATEWADYETTHGYSGHAHQVKHQIVERLLQQIRPRRVLDLGANAGEYSRTARALGAEVVAVDGDPSAVERAWRRLAKESETGILPLWVDLTNPGPSHGWAHAEWPAFSDRVQSDVLLALALVHHLAIGNNVPLVDVADFFARLARRAIVEWVPKDDPQVQRLLVSREDVFGNYSEEHFREAFGRRFTLERREPVGGSGRVLYSFVAHPRT